MRAVGEQERREEELEQAVRDLTRALRAASEALKAQQANPSGPAKERASRDVPRPPRRVHRIPGINPDWRETSFAEMARACDEETLAYLRGVGDIGRRAWTAYQRLGPVGQSIVAGLVLACPFVLVALIAFR